MAKLVIGRSLLVERIVKSGSGEVSFLSEHAVIQLSIPVNHLLGCKTFVCLSEGAIGIGSAQFVVFAQAPKYGCEIGCIIRLEI